MSDMIGHNMPPPDPSAMDEFLRDMGWRLQASYQCESGHGAVKSHAHFLELKRCVKGMNETELRAWIVGYINTHNTERKATREDKKAWVKDCGGDINE